LMLLFIVIKTLNNQYDIVKEASPLFNNDQ